MKESQIQRAIIKAISDRYKVKIVKISDRITRGIPDLIVFGCREGQCVTILMEIKTPKGRVSAIQEYWHSDIRKIIMDDGGTDSARGGLRIDVVRSVEQAIEICEDESLIRKDVK